MRKVLTAEQMREVDRLTSERYGVPSILLMENAAQAVANVIADEIEGTIVDASILILCGKGNNGGDGAALARILEQRGAIVTCILFGTVADTTGDARVQFEILERFDAAGHQDFWQITNYSEGDGETLRRGQFDVVVDAMVGIGLTRPLGDPFDSVILDLVENSAVQLFVSIDIASGLFANDPELRGVRFGPEITVTFTSPKPAQVLPPAAGYGGRLVIAPIGSPDQLIDEQLSSLFIAESADASVWLAKTEFSSASYKNKRGHALVIGGSRNYSGAAVLVGNAAIRTGVGLVTVAVPEDSRDGTIGRVSPEVMVRGISQTESGSAAEKAADEVLDFLGNVDAAAIGSGLSAKEDETKRFVRRIVEERRTPVIIDADGLTALSPWSTTGSAELPLILTPHEGEFKRMLGVEGDEAKEALKDRVGAVRDFATEHGVYLILKGERNLIGSPDGRVVVNPTGNPGLGKAGNGDTLTGIIAGFVAQAVQMEIGMLETLVAAVYIAGMAGDVAAQKFGKRVMTASDVRDCLADVFAELEPNRPSKKNR